jgi:hypothetical protein
MHKASFHLIAPSSAVHPTEICCSHLAPR